MVQQLKPEGAPIPDSMVSADHDLPEFTPVTVQDFLKTVPQETFKNQPVSAQSFAREMTQLVMKSFNVNPLSGMSEASLTLTPENLGKVEVKISVHNGQVIAHFAAQTVLGKEMIEGQLSQLRLNLQNQGIQVERLEVAQASSLASGMFQDQRQQQSSQQFTRQNRERTIEAELTEEDYAKEISQLMNIRQQAFGATVDTTA
ncbi:flagellar hook-length control protein FliK [Paenibacillus sp. CC-CFT747]|nr:flagellar hook-length control protein FliK [Paenibacillus sp. CC-CFT747]